MKQKRSLMAVILVIILLTFAVSGTIAYLKTNTGTVTNTFTPTKVDTEIVEGFVEGTNETVKSSIKVVNSNAADAIPVYVRVAVVGNWYNEQGEIVSPWTLPESSLNKDAWTKIGDYYYHKNPVAVGGYTANLLGNGATIAKTDTNHPNLHLEVTVIQQAIQAEPASAVAEAWKVVKVENGSLVKSNG